MAAQLVPVDLEAGKQEKRDNAERGEKPQRRAGMNQPELLCPKAEEQAGDRARNAVPLQRARYDDEHEEDDDKNGVIADRNVREPIL